MASSFAVNGSRSRPLRLAMVCGYRPTPAGGGIERHVYELTRGLLDRGVNVEVICEDRPFLPDTENPLADCIVGVPPETLHSRDAIDRVSEKSRRFAEIVDRGRYDLVHAHAPYGLDIGIRRRGNGCDASLVATFHLTAHGPIERYRSLGLGEPEEARSDRSVAVIEQAIGHLSDGCIAVSRSVAEELVELYGVPTERVHVVSNWYDATIFRPRARDATRRRLDLRRDGRYLLYVGHFQMSRGKILAEAMRRLPHDITLLVAHHETDGAVAAEFGDRVRFIGHASRERLSLYYCSVDLLCFPSLYGGFGLVLLEAMACGCPPVAFNYGAMNEVVRRESGYLVTEPTADAFCAAILHGLSDRGRKAGAARERAQAFRMDTQIDAVLDLYRALSRPSAPVPT